MPEMLVNAGPAVEPATYRDGEPTNLPAAALDALEWLKVMRIVPLRPVERRKLLACIAALEEHLLPHMPAVFEADKTADGTHPGHKFEPEPETGDPRFCRHCGLTATGGTEP